jgi:hypothetical protein
MAQGSRPIRIRLNMPDNPHKEFPPTSRMGKPIPGNVGFERYLEPAGWDRAASRERFRIRHRIDLAANSIFPFARIRERESRSLYGPAYPLSGELEINLKNVSSEAEAIRLLCQPFGEIESIVPSNESHPGEGFIVRFFDRDVTLRAQQQLSLLMGVSCFRVVPSRSSKDSKYSPGPERTSSAAAPEILAEPVVSTTPAFADAVKGDLRPLLKASQEDWPALPNLKPTAKKELPTVPVSPEVDGRVNMEEPPDPCRRPSRVLSPVSEEHSFDDPDDYSGSHIDKEPLSTTVPELCGVAAESSLLSTTPPTQPDGKSCSDASVLGLVDVPPLQPTSHLTPPEAISIQSSYTRQSPVVQLGSLPQTGSQSRSGIDRMTVLVRQLPLDTSQDSLRERFKPYGRLVSAI